MFTVTTVTHYMLEHGEPAGCGIDDGGVTLAEAITNGCKIQEDQPHYDGRGPKVVSVSFADANDGEGKGDEFAYYGEWSAETSLACTRYLVEAFDVGRTYYKWGC